MHFHRLHNDAQSAKTYFKALRAFGAWAAEKNSTFSIRGRIHGEGRNLKKNCFLLKMVHSAALHAVSEVNRLAFPRDNNKKRIPFAGLELGRTYALPFPASFVYSSGHLWTDGDVPTTDWSTFRSWKFYILNIYSAFVHFGLHSYSSGLHSSAGLRSRSALQRVRQLSSGCYSRLRV